MNTYVCNNSSITDSTQTDKIQPQATENFLVKDEKPSLIEAYFGCLDSFQLTTMSYYSSTPAVRHEEFWNLVKNKVKSPLKIADLTACIGCDTIHFARHEEVSRILSFEKDDTNFTALQSNINTAKLKNKVLIRHADAMSTDSITLIQTFAPHWIYIDPPWCVGETVDYVHMPITFGGKLLADVVRQCFESFPRLDSVLLKLPTDYKVKVPGFKSFLLPTKKFLIVMFNKI